MKLAEDTQRQRDLFVHGSWTREKSQWYVVQTRGTYPQDYVIEARSRRVAPEGIRIGLADLCKVTATADELVVIVKSLRKAVLLGLKASREKRPPQ